MSSNKTLTPKDYALWIVTILAFFFFFLWIGDFGNLSYLTQSPITTYVQTLWSVTYIAAGGVFAVFMGSIVFLSVKFRATSGVQTTRRAVNTINYYYVALILDLLFAIIVTYEMFIMSTYQFITGVLASADLLLFASIIYLVYKLYYQE
ncbi:MAG: quinol oxidase subunit 2 [Saccharolobus sp.]|uniref:Quinol oxidase-2, putative subunit (SoxI-like) (SoxI-like) n=1 Tax=Saccharolobus shibatae (strain ATCC 51178 / DSM 5389 / JCM 8931 / NBRC 15437 / B12) TaxID=523848 RepID=A0A8F5BLT3_SACSH|nr:quinol oxidase subunit 2 [Saccharolobus shibatae]MCH4815628.1 quinol oxidase subunit 2 [Saccharolobus shibatae]QXJ27665.1 Quinol oxidase-2, putative subunit (SoxI-like) (soxI-like) [Saccharolobus shibatae B12]